MDFVPFYTKFKDLAAKETRSITITAKDLGVPPGEYGLIEYYCTDDTCDCRKVMLQIVESIPPHKTLATIGYGWESVEFYTKWMHGDKKLGQQITGAYLEVFGTQSQYAQKFLELVPALAFSNEYIERLKRHYKMFKNYTPNNLNTPEIPHKPKIPHTSKKLKKTATRLADINNWHGHWN